VMMGSLGWAFGSPRRLSFAERAAGLGGRIVARRGRIGRVPFPGMLGRWFRWRDLPAPARQSFRAWWRKAGSSGDRP
jgi:L-lactate dehydrogenase complex protein LldF